MFQESMLIQNDRTQWQKVIKQLSKKYQFSEIHLISIIHAPVYAGKTANVTES